MKNRLFENPGLKVASLIIAFIVWLVIMNVSNPVITRTISNIPVNVSNASYIESMNLTCAIAEGFENISVSVEANRSIVERLTPSSISANVDLTQIIDMDASPVMAPVTVSVPGVTQNGITVIPRNIQLRLEEMESRDFVINPVAGSTTPARGYEVGTLVSNPEKMTIRGPQSLVEKIDKVQAEVDVTNLREDATLGATIHIYDKNGDELNESRMKYLTFSVNESAIRVHVELYSVLTDVAIHAETYGDPASGYQVGEITVTPQTISIAGTDTALSEFREAGNRILITRESQAVDISGASSDVEIRVNLPDYLPGGIRLADGFSDTVVVTVKILEFNTKSVELETKTIEKNNLKEGFSAVFDSAVVDIRVKGENSALNHLTAEDISASVDLTDLRPGTSAVPVYVELPDGFSPVEDVSAEITVTETTVLQQSEETDAGN